MGKEKVVAVGSHEVVPDQFITGVVVPLHQVSHSIESKALTDDRGGLQCSLVRWRQTVHARQYDALYRGRNLCIAALLGVAQELFEEQRVALCTFDAGEGELVGRVDEGAGQRQGFLLSERSEIDTHQGAASGRGAPRLIEWIAFDPRCQYQKS